MRKAMVTLCAFTLGILFWQATGASAQAKKPAPEEAATAEQAASAPDTPAKLPVRRVVLYKNGVGYFEHLGHVRGSQNVSIDFTSSQLNDVLKSLTVLDLSGGRIAGVDYNSEAPLAKRLSTLRLSLGEKPTVAEFLGALRGARLEVRSVPGAPAGSVTGRLLSIERKTRSTTAWAVETDEISLITDTGEVRTVDLSPATSVRITERDLNIEVGRYLSLLGSSREHDLRRMTISTAGSGDRNLYVSYISEMPIWKTTYRVVLPSKGNKSPLLQGWAIVDNTVGEDWDNVELSLVAGAPHSFVQQLSQPYYSRRPVVALPESAQLTPQTHSATLIGGSNIFGVVRDPAGAVVPNATVRVLNQNNSVVAQSNTDSSGEYSIDGLPVGSYRVEVEAPGFQKNVVSNFNASFGENSFDAQLRVGSMSETVTVNADSSSVNTSSSSLSGRRMRRGGPGRVPGGSGGGVFGGRIGGLTASTAMSLPLNEARAGMEAQAQGQELGDLFEYKLKDRVTIRKNRSALVPIVQAEINAEKVSLWNQSFGSARPLRALWMTNSSALTLDGGSFSVIEQDAFAGEGISDPIKPNERRLLSYATDLGLLVDTKLESEQQRVTHVKLVHGAMTQISELRERKTYTVRNEDTAPRTLIIEHPARSDWKLAADTPKQEEVAPGVYRFRMNIEPKSTATLAIKETHPQTALYQVTNLNEEQIGLFLKQQSINGDVEQALRRVVAQQHVVAQLAAEAEAKQGEIDKIVEDQGRLRENMKALKGSAEERALTQRYTLQLNNQETRIETLQKEIEGLENKKDKEQEMLNKMVEELSLDVTL